MTRIEANSSTYLLVQGIAQACTQGIIVERWKQCRGNMLAKQGDGTSIGRALQLMPHVGIFARPEGIAQIEQNTANDTSV